MGGSTGTQKNIIAVFGPFSWLFGTGEGPGGSGSPFFTPRNPCFHHKAKFEKVKIEFLYDRKVVINRYFLDPV